MKKVLVMVVMAVGLLLPLVPAHAAPNGVAVASIGKFHTPVDVWGDGLASSSSQQDQITIKGWLINANTGVTKDTDGRNCFTASSCNLPDLFFDCNSNGQRYYVQVNAIFYDGGGSVASTDTTTEVRCE